MAANVGTATADTANALNLDSAGAALNANESSAANVDESSAANADAASASWELDDLLSNFAAEVEQMGQGEATAVNDENEDDENSEDEDEEDGSETNDEAFNMEEVALLSQIGGALSNAMNAELSECDPLEELSDEDRQEVMFVVFDKVLKAMKKKGNKELDAADLAYVRARVQKEAIAFAVKRCGLEPPVSTRRFTLLDRVVCRVGGERGWAAGTVQALDKEDDEIDPYALFPYVVKVDPPSSFGFSVPGDTDESVRAEVCFGRRADAPLWTLRCLPRAKARGTRRARRFDVGERVACAVEGHDDTCTDWAAGTVRAVDQPVEGTGGLAGGVVPYQVAMDGGASVLVHQDEHWLIRDLELQPEGPRVAADGTRALARMGKRQLGDEWQMVDHGTRKVRKLEAEFESDGDE